MDLTDVVSHARAALERCPPGHNDRDYALYNLAKALSNRFKTEGKSDDMDEAIVLHRVALELRPSGHPRRFSSLHNLALCLSDRYKSQGVIADLEEAVRLARAALELCSPGHPNHDISLHNLAYYLRERFQKQAVMRDLDEAIELHRAALEVRSSGHPRRSSSLHGLSLCLSDRYEDQGVAADLEEAVTLGRAALELRPLGHPDRDLSLFGLACYLRERFKKQAVAHDLDEAIQLHQEALELRPSRHPDRSLSLYWLAVCLVDRYDNQGVVADLEEAVTFGRAALELRPPGHPHRGVSLNNLASDLWKMFKKQAAAHDLDEAIKLHREALELRPFGHPHRSSSLAWLALCLSERYDNQGVVVDLEEAVTLERAALELRPPGHSDRDVSLYNLAYYLGKRLPKQTMMHGSGGAEFPDRATLALRPTSCADAVSSFHALSLHHWVQFQKQAAVADLDEAICLATYALELRLPKDRDYAVSVDQLSLFIDERVKRLTQETNQSESIMLCRAVDNLCALGHNLRDRVRNQHGIVDLHEAITLHELMLQLRPAGHANHPSYLHDLALCLIDRFHATAIVGDLDEAIKLEQKALELSVPADPSYDVYKDSLATYLQMKISSRISRASSIRSVATEYEVSQVIRHVIFETLETTPTRLLNTQKGILCDRDAQILQFMRGQQYIKLLSSAMSYGPVERIHRIHADISRYFRFVMLSHRWGQGEPSLRDIQGHRIYDMTPSGGVKKLQNFCLTALKRGYLWAWCDTCCIDKESSAELQEAIGSMFGWYRRSALTIVYLADVPETGSFARSQWFGRGWTLQELLAPRTVLFYTRTWSLYKNIESSNHKTDAAVLEELARATGIASRFLTDFTPGLEEARSRLRWASSRRTTRPEDIAYSLFGTFNLHLPVLYGESAEFALGRLLVEVISRSGDISILDWVGEASTFHSCFPASITSYRTSPLPHVPPSGAEKQSSTASQQLASSKALQKLYRSLTKSPLPRFLNRRLTLPCFFHHITAIQLKSADPSSPSYTYEIQASGLRPLEITLPKVPEELENAAMENVTGSSLQLVRPWHSKSLGGSTKLDAAARELLLLTLERPFNALLLTELPHNEYKRIASSTLIAAQPVDSASILQSRIQTFNII